MRYNTELHPKMLETLELAPKTRGGALLIRHSTRFQIPFGELGINVPLSDKGIKLAEEFGRKIKEPINRILSSPCKRCIDTGKAIANGSGIKITIIPEQLLGEPGAFVFDIEKSKPWFFFPLEMINLQLKGVDIPGTRQIEDGVQLILELLFNPLPNPGCLNIFITHDSVLICIILYFLNKISVTQEEWPWMLEGCIIWKLKSTLNLAWRGKVYSRPFNH